MINTLIITKLKILSRNRLKHNKNFRLMWLLLIFNIVSIFFIFRYPTLILLMVISPFYFRLINFHSLLESNWIGSLNIYSYVFDKKKCVLNNLISDILIKVTAFLPILIAVFLADVNNIDTLKFFTYSFLNIILVFFLTDISINNGNYERIFLIFFNISLVLFILVTTAIFNLNNNQKGLLFFESYKENVFLIFFVLDFILLLTFISLFNKKIFHKIQ